MSEGQRAGLLVKITVAGDAGVLWIAGPDQFGMRSTRDRSAAAVFRTRYEAEVVIADEPASLKEYGFTYSIEPAE